MAKKSKAKPAPKAKAAAKKTAKAAKRSGMVDNSGKVTANRNRRLAMYAAGQLP